MGKDKKVYAELEERGKGAGAGKGLESRRTAARDDASDPPHDFDWFTVLTFGCVPSCSISRH